MTSLIPQQAPPSGTSDDLPPRLRRVLDKLGRRDFSSLPAGAAEGQSDMDLMVMLSDAELKREREQDNIKALISQVESWRHHCAAARIPYEQIWLKNIDMYEGRQFTEYDPNTKSMREIVYPDGRVRIAMNVCQPTMRTEMAKTSSSHPMVSVQAASNDLEDVMAARAAEGAWEWFYANEKIQSRVMNMANYWRATTGNGFIKTFYDTSSEDTAATAAARKEWKTDTEAQAQAGAGGLFPPMPTPKPAAVFGKVTAEPVSPFHLYIPELAEPDIQRQPYVIQLAYIPRERAKLIYGGSMPKDWEPAAVDSTEIFEINAPGSSVSAQSTIDLCRVTEVWIKPNVTRWLPEGGLVVLVDNQLVAMSKDGLPYEHGEFPYQHLYTVETGRFYRMSVLEAIIPIQNELNRIFAQLIEYKNLATAPMYFFRQGSVDVRRIRTKPGTYIPVQFGAEFPQAVPLPQLPAYVSELIEQMKALLEDISGQHQVSRSIAPGADIAASAVAMLREPDDDYLSNTVDSIEAAFESMGRHAVALMVQFWDKPRLVKVAGTSEEISARLLTQADIASGTDLRVTIGTGLPQSRSARTALVTEWMDKGYIPPEIGLKVIEGGALGDLWKVLKIDEDAAERENVEMMELITEEEYAAWAQGAGVDPATGEQMPMVDQLGQPMMPEEQVDPATGMPAPPPSFYPVNDWDNHPKHIEVIERAMKGQRFRQLEPWRQQMMKAHRQAHVAALGGYIAVRQQLQAAITPDAANPQNQQDPGYAGPDGGAEPPAPPTE
jgi:hypothetical protein